MERLSPGGAAFERRRLTILGNGIDAIIKERSGPSDAEELRRIGNEVLPFLPATVTDLALAPGVFVSRWDFKIGTRPKTWTTQSVDAYAQLLAEQSGQDYDSRM